MDELGYSVYKHRFPNGKVYIGVTGCDPCRRWAYGYGYSSRSDIMQEIQNCGGWNNIAHVILCGGLTKEQAYGLEKTLIHEAVCDLGRERVLNVVWAHGDPVDEGRLISHVSTRIGGQFAHLLPHCDWLDRYNMPTGEIALSCKIDHDLPVVTFAYERRTPERDTDDAYGFEIHERAMSFPSYLRTVDELALFLSECGYEDTHFICHQEAQLPKNIASRDEASGNA